MQSTTLRRTLASLALFAVPANATPQIPVLWEEGTQAAIVVGDFNKDGRDDFLAIGHLQMPGQRVVKGFTRLGNAEAPYYFNHGPDWQGPQYDVLLDEPVWIDGTLYLAHQHTKTPGSFVLEAFRYETKGWKSLYKQVFLPTNLWAKWNSVEITRGTRDFDGDKKPDLMVAWSEIHPNPSPNTKVFCTYFAVGANTAKTWPVKAIGGQPAIYYIEELMVCEAFQSPTKKDHLMVLSGEGDGTGFGFQILKDGTNITTGGSLWAQSGPTLLLQSDPSLLRPKTLYSVTAKLPLGKTLTIQLSNGLCAVIDQGLTEPFQSNTGEVLFTDIRYFLLPGGTADFDGNGSEECVMAIQNPDIGPFEVPYPRPTLWVGGVSSLRPYMQVFNFVNPNHHHMPVLAPDVFGAVAGDFDGNGTKDLAVLYTETSQGVTTLVSLLQNKTPKRGKPSLVKIY